MTKSFYDAHPQDYPPTLQWALIAAEARWRRAAKIARNHAEAFTTAQQVAGLWHGKEPAVFYFQEPTGFNLWGILLQVTLRDQETMRDVGPMLEALMDAGWAVGPGQDCAELKRRNFHCTKNYAVINLMVFAESEQCKVIEDGTEPKYRLVCGDAA